MPLWLQGLVESVVAALATAVVVMVPLVGIWIGGGFADTSVDFVGRLGGQAWLALHGVPLNLVFESPSAVGDTVTGTFRLLAWGLVLIPAWWGWRAGRRLARASYTDQLWQALLGAAGGYVLFSGVTAVLSADATVRINPLAGALLPTVLVMAAAVAGARREAGSWGRLIGVDLAERIAARSQHSRWAGSYLWSILRAGLVGLLAAFALAAVVLSVQLIVHWAEIALVYQRLEAGIWGGLALTIVQLGLIPNLVVWTMAYTAGPGFSLGEGAWAGPLDTAVGPLPSLPLLAAVPTESHPVGWLFLLLPVLAGVVAGWWLFREAENHLDEWLALKVEWRWLSLSLSTLALGLLVAVASAVLALLPLALSGGSLGVGSLHGLGPNPWAVAPALGGLIGLGAMIGTLVAPLGERHRYVVPAGWDDAAEGDDDVQGDEVRGSSTEIRRAAQRGPSDRRTWESGGG